MVNVVYSSKKLSITGHAMSNKKGIDLVCAGVSSIVMGALNWFDHKDVKITIDEKTPLIEIELLKNNKQDQMKIKLIVIQLKSIQYKNKKFIKISEGK